MKRKTTLILAGAAGLALTSLQARDEERGEGPPPRPQGPPPLAKALDTDEDGVISMMDIANAAQSLLVLDTNGDGELTRDEIHLAPPEGKEESGSDREQQQGEEHPQRRR